MCNNLSPAQIERYALLFEEMAEAIQVIGKILRHGVKPTDPHTNITYDNTTDLEREIGQIKHAIILAESHGDISELKIMEHTKERFNTVNKYLHHN